MPKKQNEEDVNNITNQFSIRIKTYNHSANWMLDSRLIKAHVDALGNGNKRKCLELCCGTGIIGNALKKYNWDMTGLDLTKEMVEVANQFFPTVIGNVQDIPFESNQFNTAVLRQSFMLLNGSETLKEIHRVLKKDGEFLLSQSVPFNTGDDEHYQKVQWTRHINMKKYYNTKDLSDELAGHDFEILETVYLCVEESINKWLDGAPELSSELRSRIFSLIAEAPESYKIARNVHVRNGELFENWNWVLIKARAIKP
jgi:DNA gyrase subunit B